MGAALALAAGLAIAVLLIPKRAEEPVPVPTAPRTASVVPPPPAVQSAASVQEAEPLATLGMKPVRRPARRTNPSVRLAGTRDGGFIRLDDEPFETGVVARVTLGPQQVPADVIFGSDGRPRAIRLVNSK